MVTVGQSALARKGTAKDWAKHVFNFVDADNWGAANIKSGLSSGEGLITAVRDEVKGRNPIRKNGEIVDWQEIVAEPGVTDKRLLVLETEFSGVLQALKREGNRLSSLMRQGWDDGNLSTMTKTPYTATGAHISILGHISILELLKLMAEVDFVNGFANRFWWFAVRSSRILPFGGTPDIRDLTGVLNKRIQSALKVDKIGWTDQAHELWASSMYPELRQLPVGLMGEVLTRAAPHVRRVAGIYCLADGKQLLEPVHLEVSKALWDASVRCATYIFGKSLGNPIAEKLRAALRGVFPRGLTKNEILEDVFQRNTHAKIINAALCLLVQSGLVREVKEPREKGRPTLRYFLVS